MIKPTEEQQAVIGWRGNQLIVNAFAGTGKTSTLVEYAKANPQLRMLYVAFNRAVREEAEAKFPRNVTCKTTHQLAYAVFGRSMKDRLRPNLQLMDVAQGIDSHNWMLVRAVQDTLKTFMASGDSRILVQHTPFAPAAEIRGIVTPAKVIADSTALWQRMTSPQSAYPVTHDTYLKLYQLSQPDLSQRFDVILFDEAQDANPVTHDILLNNHAKIVMVGDAHQQIYRFRGAVDALKSPKLTSADRLWLTHSFRFGRCIADAANALLSLDGETKKIIGRGGDDILLPEAPKGKQHRALLSRTVSGVIESALVAVKDREKIFFVNGISAYRVDDLINLHWFSRNEKGKLKNSQLASKYKNYQEYREIAEASGDAEMLLSVKIIDKFYPLPKKIADLQKHIVTDERQATLTVTTAHRAKGLEWNTVQLNDDFPDILDPDMDNQTRTDEINLLYVATTRARKTLVANQILLAALKRFRR
ncbi:TPA: ATP-dependent helicase [Raoultella ornithinolytica]|nr:ATP-dependent helicase [Raoultella ornithinolytica]HAT1670163.1 ATP-dependent helicase [Raoultella ornithinolytica]